MSHPTGNALSATLLADTEELLFKKPFINESRCAPDTGIDADSGNRAIPGTGAALHAGIRIDDMGSVFGEQKDLVGTDLQTPAAANAFLTIQLQRCHIAQIAETFHRSSQIPYRNIPANTKITLTIRAHPIAGMAIRISFFTPDREV